MWCYQVPRFYDECSLLELPEFIAMEIRSRVTTEHSYVLSGVSIISGRWPIHRADFGIDDIRANAYNHSSRNFNACSINLVKKLTVSRTY